MSLPAIVLAAGASRRLGQPKQLVLIDEETLLARTIRVTREAGMQPICVVLGAYAEEIQRIDQGNAEFVENAGWEEGISSSIRAGLSWLEAHVPAAAGVLLEVCDQPYLTVEHIRQLHSRYAACKQSCMVASVYAGVRGVPAIIPRSLFPELLALQGDQGARKILQNSNDPVVEVAFECGIVDIDTPEDLSQYVTRIRES